MTQTEIEGVGPEQQLNTQSELDPRSVVTFVYRGENPYMRFLARGLQARGVPVNVREVSMEAYDQYCRSLGENIKTFEDVHSRYQRLPEEERVKLAESIIPPLDSNQGLVVTDLTLRLETETLFGRKVIRGYQLLEWGRSTDEQEVVEKLTPLIDQIRAAGKQPVVLQAQLGDHISFIKELADPRGNSYTYVALIQKNFDIPVIPFEQLENRDDFNMEHNNLPALLKKIGVDSSDAVLLIDHHLYYLKKHIVLERGFGSVEVARICPCCLANTGDIATDKLLELGFKLFPAQVEPDNEVIDKLMGRIEETEAEIEAEEPSPSK